MSRSAPATTPSPMTPRRTARPASAGRSSRRRPTRVPCATATSARAWTRSPRSPGVSKQTVYKHFADKERLFSEIVSSTVDEVSEPVHDEVLELEDSGDLEADLRDLARRQLGRGDAAAAPAAAPAGDRARRAASPSSAGPSTSAGPGRTIAALAAAFERLAAARRCWTLDDPRLAAQQFNWLIMSRAAEPRRCSSATTRPAAAPSSTATPTPACACSSPPTATADRPRHGSPGLRDCAQTRRGASMSIIERTAEPTVDDAAAIAELHEMLAAPEGGVPARAVPDAGGAARAAAGARRHGRRPPRADPRGAAVGLRRRIPTLVQRHHRDARHRRPRRVHDRAARALDGARAARRRSRASTASGRAFMHPQPKGVVGNIAPWNFPFDIAARPAVRDARRRQPRDHQAVGLHAGLRRGPARHGARDVRPRPRRRGRRRPRAGQGVLDAAAGTTCSTRAARTSASRSRAPRPRTSCRSRSSWAASARRSSLADAVDARSVEQIIGIKSIKNGQMCISVDYCLVPRERMDEFVRLAREHVARDDARLLQHGRLHRHHQRAAPRAARGAARGRRRDAARRSCSSTSRARPTRDAADAAVRWSSIRPTDAGV